jgi:hypothetical protein
VPPPRRGGVTVIFGSVCGGATVIFGSTSGGTTVLFWCDGPSLGAPSDGAIFSGGAVRDGA